MSGAVPLLPLHASWLRPV